MTEVKDLSQTSVRVARLEALADEYPGDWTPDCDGAPFEELAESRFAVVIDRESSQSSARDWWLSTRETLADALAVLAEAIIDGQGPHGIFDLDTGQSHGYHVSTPIVSDTGGEGCPPTPWPSEQLPAIDPGEGVTSAGGWTG